MKKLGLLPRLIIAIILGILIGLYGPDVIVKILITFNGLFGNFLNFVIPLIILGFVAPGIGDLGENAGKLLGITAGIAYGSTVIFGSLAYLVASIFLPRIITPGAINFNPDANTANILEPFFESPMPPVFEVTTALILAFIIGIGIASLKTDSLKRVVNDFAEIITKLINTVVIPLLPIHILGIFANMAYQGTVATVLTVFAKVFVMVILVHWVTIIIQYTVGSSVNGSNPFTNIKKIIPAYMTAIGTQSSAATIPVTLRQTYTMGVNKEIADFVVPLGATIHLSGSMITILTCSMSIIMLNGGETHYLEMLPFIMTLGVTMVAAPGVPGGAVMAALGILETQLGFTQPMLGLMIALYVAQDSFGTACNISGDGAIALLVNKISGNKLDPNQEINIE